KKLFVSVLIIITVISVNAQQKVDIQKNNLKLSVDLTSIAHPLDKIYLTYYNTSTKVRFIDSIDVSQSRIANFTTYLPEPILGTLRIA
ncbi:hypothetical protein, partial [Streptomyces galilaeus]|uniref:hypothetical protein n=1 Tax=Streptomyces galilaeus TaxID=33899 RepID=UPI0038F62A56